MKTYLASALAIVLSASAAAEDPVRFIPASATAAMLVRTEAFRAAPMVAQIEAEGHPLVAGAEGSQWLMLASDLDVRFMYPSYRVFVASYDSPQNFAEQVRQVGAETDTISGRPAVWVEDRVCIVAFAPQLFGGIGPVNRQQASQWAEAAVDESSPGPEYLKSVLRSAESSDDLLVLAIELHELFRRQEIEAAVQRSGLFPAEVIDAVTLAFASVRGVTVRVRAGAQASGRLQVDFDGDATVLHPQAKPILLGVLAAAGAQISDLSQWTPINGPQSIGLQGPLSAEGLHRVTDVLHLDSRPIDQALGIEPPGPASAAADARPAVAVAPPPLSPGVSETETALRHRGVASRRYYSRIHRMIDTLQQGSRGQMGNIALWLERDAAQIQRMSTRNVDPELAEYSRSLAYQMRTMVGILSGLNQQVASKLAEASPQVSAGVVPTGRTANYGGSLLRRYAPYYNVHMDVGAAYRAQQEAQQLVAAGSRELQQMAQQQIQAFERLGDRLEQRYGIPFDR